MKIKILDASNYFRGLLLLMRQDRKIDESEAALMKKIGKKLGFEKDFCESTINEFLYNDHVNDSLPVFSSKELAMKFIKDGLALASSDVEVHDLEENWLRRFALGNKIEIDWFENECMLSKNKSHTPLHLEVDGLKIEHTH